MKICVQGLWHLGTVTAACMASAGHAVMGLDFCSEIIENIKKGVLPVFEPGLKELVQKGLDSNQLTFTADHAEAHDAEVLWIAYDTPVDQDDQADHMFVIEQTQRTLPFLKNNALVIVSSQLPVLSVQLLEQHAMKYFPNKHLKFACVPENLRLGKALEVFMRPDRIVVGIRCEQDKVKIENLFAPIAANLEWMSVESAEMTKHAINSFLALSVTFANEIASLCEAIGADAKEVERGLKTEKRIGPGAYLAPGGAFAGGTLARDIMFLAGIADRHGLPLTLIKAINESNANHKLWVREKLLASFSSLAGVEVAVWGLTYKPGTNTLRRSMAVELCDWLLSQKANVRVYDPSSPVLPERWKGKVISAQTPLEALKGAAAMVVGTEWPTFCDPTVAEIVAIAPRIIIYDSNRFLKHLAGNQSIKYISVGMSIKEHV